jgi:hypothetical protein
VFGRYLSEKQFICLQDGLLSKLLSGSDARSRAVSHSLSCIVSASSETNLLACCLLASDASALIRAGSRPRRRTLRNRAGRRQAGNECAARLPGGPVATAGHVQRRRACRPVRRTGGPPPAPRLRLEPRHRRHPSRLQGPAHPHGRPGPHRAPHPLLAPPAPPLRTWPTACSPSPPCSPRPTAR